MMQQNFWNNILNKSNLPLSIAGTVNTETVAFCCNDWLGTDIAVTFDMNSRLEHAANNPKLRLISNNLQKE